jgi:2-methylcitrate dehydratase PrpD
MTGTVSERLIAFVRAQQAAGTPSHAVREANRLIVNQLKASVGARDEAAVRILRDWARGAGGGGSSTVLWFGDALNPEHACILNAALFEVLDFNETYIPTFQHAVSGVLPAVLATAQAVGSPGAAVLEALALGIEVELACAAILMPTAYYRGFVPGGITGAIGGALACGLLRGLDDVQLRNALGLAMNSGLGFYQSAGSMALPYVMGLTARNGLTACDLAAAGMDAPAAAFEGDKGMLSSYSDAPPETIETVLSTLGERWRIMGQSYKTVPTETITHGPIECVLALLKRSDGRTPARLTFGVEAVVVKIADERGARFGAPSNNLEAKFDLRHCAAAAWMRGRFTLAEMEKTAFTDPAILDLRSRIDLVADPEHKTFEGASCDIAYTDGSADREVIPAFLGTPNNPMSDAQLSDVFRLSAEGVLSPARAQAVLDAAWGLPTAPDLSALMSAAVVES